MKIITIAGNVGKDGRLGRTQKGDAVLSFPVAVDHGYGGDKTTMWFDVSLWGKRGEALEPHIRKGSQLTAIGELGTRMHEGKTYLTVRASEIKLQGGKPANAQSAPVSNDMDDDLPF